MSNRVEGLSNQASWELLRRCTAGGSDIAWQEFVRRQERKLNRLLSRLWFRGGAGGDTAEIEDLLQEVYCRLLAGRNRVSRRFRGGTDAEVEVYLRRVVRSVVLDSRRDARAAKRGGGRLVSLAEDEFVLHEPVSPDRGAEVSLMRRERRQLLLRACRVALGRSATAESMQILELALLEGWTSQEIAAALPGGKKAATIDSMVHRLRRRFERSGVVIPRRSRRVLASSSVSGTAAGES